ncbi:DsbA family protein [Bifidobacterium aquikefiricola]|uniref:Thioredoxin domain-containing protein n=1 Tax=Bifidobacterium aquikefiricola TaxID=3059038 RepID=A0AB39U744_9BIFI
MAQNPNKKSTKNKATSASSSTRAPQNANARNRRRAAEEQAEREQAAVIAKERKQQTIIGIIVVAVVVVLVAIAGFSVWRANRPVSEATVQQSYDAAQAVKTKPSGANSRGGFLISKRGLDKKIAKAPTVEIYMDFLCPGCGSLNRTLDPTLTAMEQAGQINIEIYPSAFLDSLTTDQYSTRTASQVAYIAQNDPDHVIAFIANLFAEDFQPSESDYKAVSDATLQQLAVKSGVPSDVAKKSTDGTYKSWITKISAYTPLRKELWNISGSRKGQMTTPTVRINENYWDLVSIGSANSDLVSDFLKAVGLPESEIGTSGKLPSIGGTGKPIAIS